MHSPKQQALIAFNMSRSELLNAYFNQTIDAPEVQQLPAFRLDKPAVLPLEGTFPLFELDDYRDMFFDVNRRRRANVLIGTYVITNHQTGRVYVGSTNDFYGRWKKHAQLLRRGKHTNMRLQDEYDTFGDSGFTITLLNTFPDTDDLLFHEMLATQQYNAELLLNYKSGHKPRPGWHQNDNKGQGRQRFPAKSKRGPQSTKRWFDLN